MFNDIELHRKMVAAVWAGNASQVALLVAQDPHLAHARDPFGRTLVDIAAGSVFDSKPAYREIVDILIASGAACSIFTAARAGLLDTVKALVAASPGLVHAADGEGRTPLQRAVLIDGMCAACDEVADELVRLGAPLDIFTACVFGWASVVGGETAAAPVLVDTYRQGGPPLLWAVRPRRNLEAAPVIVSTLLGAGAALDVRDTETDENTALHHAAGWADQPDVVRILLRAGADANLLNANRRTALDLAIARGHSANVELLRSVGASAGIEPLAAA